MKAHLALAAAAACFLALPFWAGSARAAVTVVGEGPERGCYIAARSGYDPLGGYDLCTAALANGLNNHDRAATYVNRGVILDMLRRYDAAIVDFNDCLLIDPSQADAYLNRGVSLLDLKQYPQALTDIDKGVSLEPSEPAVGYYDRAIAEELLGHLNEAYADYRKAIALAPGFMAAINAAARFQVVPKTGPAAAN